MIGFCPLLLVLVVACVNICSALILAAIGKLSIDYIVFFFNCIVLYCFA